MSVNVDGDRVFASVGTPPSATGVTVKSTGDIAHRVHKVVVDYTSLASSGASGDVTLWTTPPKTRVVRVVAQTTIGWAGPSAAACVVTCGRSAGGTGYLLSNSIATATLLGDTVSEMGASVVSATLADYTAAAQTISARVTATTDLLSTFTQGSTEFYIETITYP